MEPTVLIIAIFTNYNQIFIFTNRQMKHLHHIFALLYRFDKLFEEICGNAPRYTDMAKNRRIHSLSFAMTSRFRERNPCHVSCLISNCLINIEVTRITHEKRCVTLMCCTALFRPPFSLSLQVLLLMMMMGLSLPLLMLFRMCVCCHRRCLRARAHTVQREARGSNRQRPTLRQPSQCQEGARE